MLSLLFAVPLAAHAQSSSGVGDRSKKERALVDKSAHEVRRTHAPVVGAPALEPVSLLNVWTLETLPVDPAHPPAPAAVDEFLRDHYTNQPTRMDPRLLGVVLGAAHKFKSANVQVVSAFRAPKYQLMLRKKGHEVARDSEHPLGHAVDFRLPGLSTRALLRWVRSLRLGGVGYYPESAFVHADVGRVRYWRGH